MKPGIVSESVKFNIKMSKILHEIKRRPLQVFARRPHIIRAGWMYQLKPRSGKRLIEGSQDDASILQEIVLAPDPSYEKMPWGKFHVLSGGKFSDEIYFLKPSELLNGQITEESIKACIAYIESNGEIGIAQAREQAEKEELEVFESQGELYGQWKSREAQKSRFLRSEHSYADIIEINACLNVKLEMIKSGSVADRRLTG